MATSPHTLLAADKIASVAPPPPAQPAQPVAQHRRAGGGPTRTASGRRTSSARWRHPVGRRRANPAPAFPDASTTPVALLAPLPVSLDAVDAEGIERAAHNACDAHPAVIAEREACRTLADKDAARHRFVSLWTRTIRAWALANPDHDGQPLDPVGHVERLRGALYGPSKFARPPDDPPPPSDREDPSRCLPWPPWWTPSTD